MAEIYQRSTGRLTEEKIFGQRAIRFTCDTVPGRILTHLFLKRRFVSRLAAAHYKTKRSAKKIPAFMEQYGIDPSQLPKPAEEYSSFNEFFTRRLERPFSEDPKQLIAPADSRLFVHRIEDRQVFGVKGCLYTVEELLQDREHAERFRDGLCMVFRLCPTDYHRFCFPDSGSWEQIRKIRGNYNTVNTFYVSGRVHATNYRETTILHTDHFGQMAFIEVGAMLIGKIVQTSPCPGRFSKGQEKGYFEYGASTIVLLTEPGRVEIDPDILEQSSRGIECQVRCGESIGRGCF